MKRQISWILLVVLGIFLGGAWNVLPRIGAAPSATLAAETEELDSETLNQLKEIKTELKDINKFIHSGTLRVIVVMNPDQSK